MTTLPASIPGLLRRCSPVIDPKNHHHIVDEIDDGWLRPCRLYAEQVHLDLADPTGMEHAKWYLADKLELDRSEGVRWFFDAEGAWTLTNGRGYRHFQIKEGKAVQVTNKPLTLSQWGSDPVTAAEALRLAVLAVAGVQA
jgi:hypothetical protein